MTKFRITSQYIRRLIQLPKLAAMANEVSHAVTTFPALGKKPSKNILQIANKNIHAANNGETTPGDLAAQSLDDGASAGLDNLSEKSK
jgi:hypothetical protein